MIKPKKQLFTVLALLGLGSFHTLSTIMPSAEINLIMQGYFSLMEGFIVLMYGTGWNRTALSELSSLEQS